jgi:hypothetical protein
MSGESQPQQRAIRLIFEYEGDRVRLVVQQPVGMAGDASPAGTDAPGYYVDARDPAERTLARVRAREAFGRSREVFPERHDEPITRMDVEQRRGAFTVTLPASEQADHVTIVRVSEGADTAGRITTQAVDVASFPLSRSAR